MEIWHMGIWTYGHMGILTYGILYIGVPIDISSYGSLRNLASRSHTSGHMGIFISACVWFCIGFCMFVVYYWFLHVCGLILASAPNTECCLVLVAELGQS